MSIFTNEYESSVMNITVSSLTHKKKATVSLHLLAKLILNVGQWLWPFVTSVTITNLSND